MATRTLEVEEEIIVRAESLHIHDPPNQNNEERINSDTGHMEPEDAAAINRAAGSDRPDPPSEHAFPHRSGVTSPYASSYFLDYFTLSVYFNISFLDARDFIT